MEEKRKNKRTVLSSKLILNRLDGGNAEAKSVDIDVIDLSKTGIGFYCNDALTIGSIYEAYLTIWTKEVLHVFIEISRVDKMDNRFSYGGIFVGMSETDALRIRTYQVVEENQ